MIPLVALGVARHRRRPGGGGRDGQEPRLAQRQGRRRTRRVRLHEEWRAGWTRSVGRARVHEEWRRRARRGRGRGRIGRVRRVWGIGSGWWWRRLGRRIWRGWPWRPWRRVPATEVAAGAIRARPNRAPSAAPLPEARCFPAKRPTWETHRPMRPLAALPPRRRVAWRWILRGSSWALAVAALTARVPWRPVWPLVKKGGRRARGESAARDPCRPPSAPECRKRGSSDGIRVGEARRHPPRRRSRRHCNAAPLLAVARHA